MIISVEMYKDETNEKRCYIACEDGGGSGADYKYETAADIGTAVAQYLETYYPVFVNDPDWTPDKEDVHEELL